MHITQHMGNGLIGQCMVMSSFVSQSQFRDAFKKKTGIISDIVQISLDPYPP